MELFISNYIDLFSIPLTNIKSINMAQSTCDECEKVCNLLLPSGGSNEICLECYTHHCRPQDKKEQDQDYIDRLPYESEISMKKTHEYYYNNVLIKGKEQMKQYPLTYELFMMLMGDIAKEKLNG